MGRLAWVGSVVFGAASRGDLPLRRNLLRGIVVGWGLLIAATAAAASHSALELLAFEAPVLIAARLAYSPRVGGRAGAAALSAALVAVATSSALMVGEAAAAIAIFAAALVLSCWLEDRLAAVVAALCVIGVQLTLAPLTPDGDDAVVRLLLLAAVTLAAAGPWRFNAKRERELDRDRQALAGLVDVSRRVAFSDDPRSALVEGVRTFAEADLVSLCQLTAAGDELVVSCSTASQLVGTRMVLDGRRSGVAAAFSARQSLLIDDVASSPLVDPALAKQTGLVAVLYEVVHVDGVAAGVLAVGWRHRLEGDAFHLRSLVSLAASEAAAAVRRHEVSQALLQQATTDPLTGACNRRVFDHRLPKELDIARAEGQPLAIAMMDLNGFKRLNDTEGHEAGDRLLRRCAEIWQAELRPGDLLVRLGGDEFAAILPNCGLGDAPAVAARLRRALHIQTRVSTGVGIAVWDTAESQGELVRRADQLLYLDKADRASDNPAPLVPLGDLPPAAELQRIVEALALSLDVPLVMLSLVAEGRQYAVAHTGLGELLGADSHLQLDRSYCDYPAASGRELTIADTSISPIYAAHPTTTDLGARAYAGIPVFSGGGYVAGVACAIDTAPRDWTADDLTALRLAAHHFSVHINNSRRS